MTRATAAEPADRRLWRVRKRHDHVDAVLRVTESTVELRYFWNDRLLAGLPYATEQAARAEGTRQRRELERAGWTEHW